MCFDRTFPPLQVTEFAKRLDRGGVDQLWVIEDCFYTAGVSLAAAALTVTDRLTVGLGILPARARTAAITAMEIATLCGLAPGRVLPGIGHGVQSWMAQMGVRPASPLGALDEVLVAVRRLLDGEEVSFEGQYVYLDRVRLDQPPQEPPPILAGVRGPKSLALAGKSAGGVLLAEGYSPYVAWAREQTGRSDADFHFATFASLCVAESRKDAYRWMAPWLASMIDESNPGLPALPFISDLKAWYAAHGTDGLVEIPQDWWAALGPIGTFNDALAYLATLDDAGVRSVGFYPAPELEVARQQIDDIIALAAAR